MGRAIVLIILLITFAKASTSSIQSSFNGSNFIFKYTIKPNGLNRTGERCGSDYSCASLCCKHGRCASHNPSMGAYCNKSVGQSCVSRNYCAKQTVEACYIVITGKNPRGEITCALRCYQKRVFSRCRNSRCTSLAQPPVPAFNPANPDCKEAIDPPVI